MAIYQDLVDVHGFGHGYNSVKRFVATLRAREPQQFDRLEFAPGEEAQVDYGEGALTFDAVSRRWKRPRPTGRAGAAAWKIVWHFTHASLGRTVRTTLKRAGTYSNCSETSTPMLRRRPPHALQPPKALFRFSRPLLTKAWQIDYNDCQPHGSLGNLTPSEYARTRSGGQPEAANL